MKAALFFAAAGLVAAQDFGGQPKCAVKCLQENIPKAGCKLDDTACQCKPDFQEKLLPIITPCLTEACDVTDLVKAQSAAAQACEDYAKSAGSDSATDAPTVAETASTGSVTVSIDTSITGSVSVPAIFSSITEEPIVPPVTPRPNNGTRTGATTPTTPTGTSGGNGGSGGESGSGGASSVPTDAGNAAAIAAPAFGLLAALAAAVAL
ncbi:hypothetical protein FSARC_7454 [Fusarium sarcochroum]|uniref:CFEM domain-containing protein n=1 Tax=Fusarium sarcochroum TaxID=1208366 RepID=A0A8H4TVC1_9HYPO|nr:hypothetical protein FSARC_7454 [Fusarium sarcochroum]